MEERQDRGTHSGYGAPSETSKRDEAMEFSDSRLWESNLRMFEAEDAVGQVSRASMEPRWVAAFGPLRPLWGGEPEG